MKQSYPLDALLNELMAVDNYLNAAQEVVQLGHMPDITALESRMNDLCNAILGAPKTEQQKFLPKLHNLVQRLNDCEKLIREWQKKSPAV